MFSRRRFLGVSAAGAAVVAVPTIVIPKAQAAMASLDERAELEPVGRVERRKIMVHKREVERLYDEEFATELVPGSMMVAHLWNLHGVRTGFGCMASGISIQKELWCDIGGRWREKRCRVLGLDPRTAPELPMQFVNFHLFNYVDPTKEFKRGWSGCCTHSHKEPYLSLRAALDQGISFKHDALQSGKWVLPGRLPAAARSSAARSSAERKVVETPVRFRWWV